MDYDVLVIGAGFAGLAAGALLAKNGLKVAVLERESQVGGRAQVLSRDGFTVDYGLHTYRFGPAGPLGKVLSALGRSVDFITEQHTHYIIQGKELLALPSEKEHDYSHVFSEKDWKSISAWLAGLLQADPDQWSGRPVREYMGEQVSDSPVEQFASLLAFIMMEPDLNKLCAGELIRFLQDGVKAGMQTAEVAGGAGSILDALTGSLKESGGQLLLDTQVQEMLITKNWVTEIVTSAGPLKSEAVVYAAPLQKLFSLVRKSAFKPGFIRRCERMVPSSGVVLDVALKVPVTDIAGFLFDPEKRIMARFTSNIDPSLAPAGRQLLSGLVLMDPEEAQDKNQVRGRIRQLRHTLKKLFPEYPQATEWQRIIYAPVMDGAAPLKHQCLKERPGVSVKEVPNLFFAGDTTSGAGLGSNIAFSSALEAAEAVKKYLGKAGKEK